MSKKKIIVIDGVPERLELAESFGAHELIDLRELPESEQRIKRVWELTGGIGAEIACDFVGFPAVMLEGLQMLGKSFLGNSKRADQKVYARMIGSAKIRNSANNVSLDLLIAQPDIDVIVGAVK